LPVTVYVLRPWDRPIGTVINVTSRSTGPGRVFSPFTLGPVGLYGGYWSCNVENAWQYAKVYPAYDSGGAPSAGYWGWASSGWCKQRADRYPMGKGAIPRYAWWDGQALGYVQARKRIYVPLFAGAVRACGMLDWLKGWAARGDLTLQDYDAYNHYALGMSLHDVLDDPSRRMGHGFVLAMLIEGVV
jgi:hypothetical protein